jgi:hypothetical protein
VHFCDFRNSTLLSHAYVRETFLDLAVRGSVEVLLFFLALLFSVQLFISRALAIQLIRRLLLLGCLTSSPLPRVRTYDWRNSGFEIGKRDVEAS